MEYKIFVFDNDKLQDIDFNFNALQDILASYNCEINTFSMVKYSKEAISSTIANGGNLILFCLNKDIDEAIVDNIKILGNDKNIIDDQVVVFRKNDYKIIFAPYDARWVEILKKLNLNPLRANKNCQLKLFGLNKTQICEKLDALKPQIEKLEYSVLSKGLLADVYISYQGSVDLVDDNQVKIASAFNDHIYSENSLEIARSIRQLANLKGIKLGICEGITGGSLLKEICSNICIKDILVNGTVEYLKTDITPEEVYNQTLRVFKDVDDDVFFINVQGNFEEDGITCIYTMGTNKAIDVYKNTFKVRKELAVKFALDAIMFNILKKLRQNSLSF